MSQFQVAQSIIGTITCQRPSECVIHMVIQDNLADLVQCGTHRRNLGQHLFAVAAFFPKTLEARGMAGNPRQSLRHLLTYGTIAMRHTIAPYCYPPTPWGIRFYYKHPCQKI